MKRTLLVLPLLLLVFLTGCQTLPKHKVHHRMVENEASMQSGKVIILPIELSVQELSAGGLTEEVPKWTETAEVNVDTVLSTQTIGQLTSDRLIELPPLTEQEQEKLDQSLVLVKTVLSDALQYTGIHAGPVWHHKSKYFDYTVGPGLAFLAEKTGADKALFLLGEDMHSTDGRKATMVVVAVLTGAVIPLGHTVMIGGMIDLKSGDVLWANTHISLTSDGFLSTESTKVVLNQLFKPYPGVADYRNLKK